MGNITHTPSKEAKKIKKEITDGDEGSDEEMEEKGCGSNKASYPRHKNQKSVMADIGINQTRPWESGSSDWFNSYREQHDKISKYRKEKKA